MVRANLLVSGQVRGVNFRESAQENAQRLNLAGWVKHVAEEGLEIEVEGSKAAVSDFIDWCSYGPSAARVERIEISWRPQLGEPTFLLH